MSDRFSHNLENSRYGVPFSGSSLEESSNVNDPNLFWKAPGIGIRVQKYILEGQVYIGEGLKSLSGVGVEPALINPGLTVAPGVFDLSERMTGYWPTYDALSPEARGAYLQWLASGRKAPEADIGLVFLYFYGLERRALADPLLSTVPPEEIEAIRLETVRLLSIYSHRSFTRYANSFIDVLRMRNTQSCLYSKALPKSNSFELIHKVSLAQAAQDKAPLPLQWALAWLELDPQMQLSSVARRCRKEFRELFALKYKERFGPGVILSPGRVRLQLPYIPASPSFRGLKHSIGFQSDLFEVNAFTGGAAALHDLAEECCEALVGYARILSKASHGDLIADPLFELPYVLWPQRQKNAIEKLRLEIKTRNKPLTISFDALKDKLCENFVLGRSQWRNLTDRFTEAGIGIEPAYTISGALPAITEYVSLFVPHAKEDLDKPLSPQYSAASITAQLTAAAFFMESKRSVDYEKLIGELAEEFSVPEREQVRLRAHLLRILAEGPRTKGLKPLIATIDMPGRQKIGDFVLSSVTSVGLMTDTRKKALEGVFKTLSLDISVIPEVPPPPPEEPTLLIRADSEQVLHPIRPPGPVFLLDKEKINRLAIETRQVAELLSDIFETEDELDPVHSSEYRKVANDNKSSSTLWGLDEQHSRLALSLSASSSWTRAAAERLADELKLMLDGALELINEAALDSTGEPFIDGLDPIEISCDLVKERS